MSGSAILDEDVLVDSLVPDVIDGLRRDLHPQFGVRPYHVYTVKRTWSGRVQGEGAMTEEVHELDPQPDVKFWDGLNYSLEKCGLDLEGVVKVTEVSLSYKQEELDGGALGANNQFFIRIGEAHGQATRSMYFTHAKPPYIDREKNMGWVLSLRSVRG